MQIRFLDLPISLWHDYAPPKAREGVLAAAAAAAVPETKGPAVRETIKIPSAHPAAVSEFKWIPITTNYNSSQKRSSSARDPLTKKKTGTNGSRHHPHWKYSNAAVTEKALINAGARASCTYWR